MEKNGGICYRFLLLIFSGDETTTIGIREELEKIKRYGISGIQFEYPGHEGEMARQMCNLFPEEKIRFYACGGTGTFRNILKRSAGRGLRQGGDRRSCLRADE